MYGVANNAPRMLVFDRTKVSNTLTAMQIGDVTCPDCVKPTLIKLPLDKIRWEDHIVISNRGFDHKHSGADPSNPCLPHSFYHGLSSDQNVFIPQVRSNPGSAIGAIGSAPGLYFSR
jgi:hypothetical protein